MRRISAALAVLLSACGSAEAPELQGSPQLSISPDFSPWPVVSLIAPSRKSFTLKNLGDAPLEVRLRHDNPSVLAASTTGAFRLHRDEMLTFTVELSAELLPVAQTGRVILQSNDPDQPELTLQVDLPAQRAPLDVQPRLLELTAPGRLCASSAQELWLANPFEHDVFVTAAEADDDAFFVDEFTPEILAPSDTRILPVRYGPRTIEPVQGVLRVYGLVEGQPVEAQVRLSGRIDEDARVTDRFEQYGPSADLPVAASSFANAPARIRWRST